MTLLFFSFVEDTFQRLTFEYNIAITKLINAALYSNERCFL